MYDRRQRAVLDVQNPWRHVLATDENRSPRSRTRAPDTPSPPTKSFPTKSP